jgi:hypothetical protein
MVRRSKWGEVMRDDDGVLRCGHGTKLHLACDMCREREERSTSHTGFWLRVVAAVSAFALGVGAAVMTRLIGM